MSRIRSRWVRFSLVLLGLFSGCGQPGAPGGKPALPFQGARLVVASVGDPRILPVIVAQRGEWEVSRGASCQILDAAVEPSKPEGAEVLIFSGDRLGDLIDLAALANLPESLVHPAAASDPDHDAEKARADGDSGSPESDALLFNDVLPAYRDQVTKYGKDRFALPLGGSALVLVYNRAAFERAENKAAAKEAGLVLEPPATWKELDQLARFFHGRDWRGDGGIPSGIALVLGSDAEGLGDSTFLARAVALGQHRDHYSLLFDTDTMEPRVASPPFVEALEGLVALKESGPSEPEPLDAEEARKAFRQGQVALLIDRAEQVGRWGGEKAKKIGVAALPGSERVYDPVNKVWQEAEPPNRPSYLPHGGGWLVGVSASAKGRQRDAAIDFIKYLINPETSKSLRSDVGFAMLPFRGTQVTAGLLDPRSAPGVESRVWSEAIGKTLLAARVVPGLRIPEAQGYLADLSEGRTAAAKGRPAEEALKGVAEAWSRRTEALGARRQLWHYHRSLNSVVTRPQPPPR